MTSRSTSLKSQWPSMLEAHDIGAPRGTGQMSHEGIDRSVVSAEVSELERLARHPGKHSTHGEAPEVGESMAHPGVDVVPVVCTGWDGAAEQCGVRRLPVTSRGHVMTDLVTSPVPGSLA